jgi:hypothetical protein
MSDIQALTDRIRELNQAVDFWNNAIIWSLVVGAIAATAVVVTTRIAFQRAKQLADAQGELIQSKDRQLALDLADKDVKIAQAEEKAADAKASQQQVELELSKQKERAARAEQDLEKEKLTRLKLEETLAPRGITTTGETNAELALFSGTKAFIEFISDSEAQMLAAQIHSMLDRAKWKVLGMTVANLRRQGVEISTKR